MVEMLKSTLDQYLETQSASSFWKARVENEEEVVHIHVDWCK